MIKQNTVFILGAGAGKDYGFPTGIEFTDQITRSFVVWYKKHLSPDSIHKTWEDFEDYEQKAILREKLRFVEDFRASEDQMDLFVSRQTVNKRYIRLGKLAIVLGIIEYEKSSKSKLRGSWYGTLFSQLTEDMVGSKDYDRFSEHNIAFITFNYDRSLEQYLRSRLLGSWRGVQEPQINEIVNSLQIVHVYGRIGKLDWENPSDELELPYGGLARPIGNYSWELTDNLQLMYGEREGDNILRAKSVLSEAERLYILGFGYSANNLQMLDFPQSIRNVTEVYGTAVGLTEQRIDSVSDKYLRSKNRTVTLLRGVDCNELVRNYPVE